MGVDEAGEQEAAGQVDHLGVRATQVGEVGSDRGDPAGADGDGQAGPLARPVEDRAVDEQRVHPSDLLWY